LGEEAVHEFHRREPQVQGDGDHEGAPEILWRAVRVSMVMMVMGVHWPAPSIRFRTFQYL
jgi:hypothetical protein